MRTTHDAGATAQLTGSWRVDPEHSRIEFVIRQLGARVRGRFSRYDVVISPSAVAPEALVTATIDLESVDTGNLRRDEHLRSSGLLQVEEHPTITYRSTNLRWSQDRWVVDGELTVRGVTRAVPLSITGNHFHEAATGERCATLSATAQISRRDFGITIPLDGGGVVVGDKIAINLEIEAVRQT